MKTASNESSGGHAATRSVGNIIVQWAGGGTLQESTGLGNWTNVLGATSPYSAPAVSAKKFYRVRQ